MKSLLSKWHNRNRRRDQRAFAASKPRGMTLHVEHLEDRLIPTVSLVNGNINITASYWGSTVQVDPDVVYTATPLGYTYDAGYKITENGVATRFSSWQVLSSANIYFFGSQFSDTFRNNTGLPSYAFGGEGRDYLYGGRGVDQLFGEGGNDVLWGGKGGD